MGILNNKYYTMELDCGCVNKYTIFQKIIVQMAVVIHSPTDEHHDISVVPRSGLHTEDVAAHLSCASVQQSDCS